jgi:tRNA threonylcarbamoyladenosine biosynthesis protein TsaB
MATGKPLVGCSTFEALVAMAAGWHGIVCPVLEARRGEVYAAFYGRQDTTVREVMPGMVTTPEALCTLVTERTLFLGSGVRVYGALWAATLGAHAVCLENGVEGELAVSVARLGQARLYHTSTAAWQTLTPLYIRAADARLPRYPVTGAVPSLPLSTTEPGR